MLVEHHLILVDLLGASMKKCQWNMEECQSKAFKNVNGTFKNVGTMS